MKEAVIKIIEAYKSDFDRVNSEERYKWEAIEYYKKKWDINATDFAGMLGEAFKKSSNLLAAAMYYPLRMVLAYAKEEPETVRELFKVLYNENLPFTERYEMFRAGFDKFVNEKKLNHYQDLRAISVYLTFEYPEKYFMYKYRMYKSFKDKVGYEEQASSKSDSTKYENYLGLCNLVCELVKQDEALQDLSRARLDNLCYKDEEFHVLTHDIIYFGSKWESEANNEGYWPSLEEYDPDLTSEDWKRFILEVEKPDHPSPMIMLKCLMDSGGEASCKQLAQKYGGNPTSYVGCSVNLGKRAKKYFDLPPCMDDGQERYFPIPFLGKYIIEDGKKAYSYKIRPELLEALKEIDLSDIPLRYEEEKIEMSTCTDVSLNTILYGPPGTGKTYNTVVYAVAIIENRTLQSVREEEYAEIFERYNEYKARGWIEFTTFHQSYGYEEFIEGIKPEMTESGDVNYSIQPGMFKRFCEQANTGGVDFETAWKQLLVVAKEQKKYIFTRRTGSTIETELREDEAFVVHWTGGETNVLKKDSILSQWKTFSYSAREDIPKGGKRWMFDANQAVIDELVNKFGMMQTFDAENMTPVNRVFVIDEINRGNISKIFGELITLIEGSKRVGQPEGMKAKLPYSQQQFGVPSNVYIIGTMNTADRSIATIDTALRRRFRFKEMLPDANVLEGIYVEDVSIKELLDKMNKRISVLYDREHTLGHAYFVPLKLSPTIEALGSIFADSIIPLLQEYFYEDYEKIRMALGDNNKSNEAEQFIKVVESDFAELFGSVEYEFDDTRSYEINQDAFYNIESYRKI